MTILKHYKPLQVCNGLLVPAQCGIHPCNLDWPACLKKELIHKSNKHAGKNSIFIQKIKNIPYPEITKILDIIKILNVLLQTKVSQNIHIPVCTFITSKNVVIWYYNNLLTIPNLGFTIQPVLRRESTSLNATTEQYTESIATLKCCQSSNTHFHSTVKCKLQCMRKSDSTE